MPEELQQPADQQLWRVAYPVVGGEERHQEDQWVEGALGSYFEEEQENQMKAALSEQLMRMDLELLWTQKSHAGPDMPWHQELWRNCEEKTREAGQ